MITRGNAFLKLEFGAKTVAHAYTLIKLSGMANFQFENEVVYMLSLILNLHSRLPLNRKIWICDGLRVIHSSLSIYLFRIEGKLANVC